MKREKQISSLEAMIAFGEAIGRLLKGGEILELSGDVGTGKTTFTKGVARGLDIKEVVQSPTFTISRIYDARDGLALYHYDFYRLHEAGIMRNELAESLENESVVVVLEWDETVQDLLPRERTVRFVIAYANETQRAMQIELPEALGYLLPAIEGDES